MMDFALKTWLDARSADYSDDNIASFGQHACDVLDETQAYLIPLPQLAVLRVSGPDSASFLQNLLTNEALQLSPDRAVLNGFCTPKGRLLASFWMWREGEDYCLTLSKDLAEPTLKKLRLYVLRSRVQLRIESPLDPSKAANMAANDSVAGRTLLGFYGEAALQCVARRMPLPPTNIPFGLSTLGGMTALRLCEKRLMLAVPSADLPDFLNEADALKPGSRDIWEALDIRDGLPQITAATADAFVPQMVNFDLLGAVSFKKGCYPGQEIVARTQYLGKLKKRMVRAHVSQGEPTPGAPLYGLDLADQACGQVVRVARSAEGGHDLLVVAQLSSMEAGPLTLGHPQGPVLALLPLPYPLPTSAEPNA